MAIGDAAFSSGDVMRRLRALDDQLRESHAGRRLENATIGQGGLRVKGTGGITLENGGNLSVEDGGAITVTDEGTGSSIRLAGSVMELLHGLLDEQPGRISAFSSGENRTDVRIRAPYTVGDGSENAIIIEGRTENSNGNFFAITKGQAQVIGETVYLTSTENIHLNADANVFVTADADVNLTATDDINLTATDSVNVAAVGQAYLRSTGAAVFVHADSVGGQLQLHAGDGLFLMSDTGNIFAPGLGTTPNAANLSIVPGSDRIAKSTSSRRYKTDIRDLDLDPDAALKLRPRTWLPHPDTVHEGEDGTARGVGFIAEELDGIGLGAFVDRDPDGRPNAISYDRLTAALVPLVQRQQQQIDDLAARVAALEASDV